MKLLIKQKLFSWTDSYNVYDETGSEKYYVKAEFISLGHQLHVYDKNYNEVGIIHEKIFSILKTFEIEMNGRIIGTIQKKFSLFTPQYSIYYLGLEAYGNLLGWDYDVRNGFQNILHISKKLLTWGDTYVLEYSDPSIELQGLMLVLAIDAANCSKNK